MPALICIDSVGLFYYLQSLPPGSWSSTLVWLLQSGEGFHFESHDPTCNLSWCFNFSHCSFLSFSICPSVPMLLVNCFINMP